MLFLHDDFSVQAALECLCSYMLISNNLRHDIIHKYTTHDIVCVGETNDTFTNTIKNFLVHIQLEFKSLTF